MCLNGPKAFAPRCSAIYGADPMDLMMVVAMFPQPIKI